MHIHTGDCDDAVLHTHIHTRLFYCSCWATGSSRPLRWLSGDNSLKFEVKA